MGNAYRRQWPVVVYIWREIHELSLWQYQSQHFETKLKKRYRIRVTPNPIKDRERDRHTLAVDNLRVENVNLSIGYIEKELALLGRRERELANALNVVNGAMGNSGISSLLDVPGEFDLTPKSVSRFTDILSCVSIIVDLDDEKYEDATGKAFVFLAGKGLGRIGLGWISTAFSVGSYVMNTDIWKERRLLIIYKLYMDKSKELSDAYEGQVNDINYLKREVRDVKNDYNKLCDELNLPHLRIH